MKGLNYIIYVHWTLNLCSVEHLHSRIHLLFLATTCILNKTTTKNCVWLFFRTTSEATLFVSVQNYRSCFEFHENRTNEGCMSSTSKNYIVWASSHNAIYVFRVGILDPNYRLLSSLMWKSVMIWGKKKKKIKCWPFVFFKYFFLRIYFCFGVNNVFTVP